MNAHSIAHLLRKLSRQANVPMPEVGFQLTANSAGLFQLIHEDGSLNFSRSRIQFNLKLAQENPDTFFNTVIHEFAHYVCYLRDGYTCHNDKHSELMKQLGATRTSSYHTYYIEDTKQCQ